MIHVQQAHGRRACNGLLTGRNPGRKIAAVVPPLDQAVDGVAVGLDGRDDHLAVLVPEHGRLLDRPGAPLDRQPERFARVVHPERDVAHAVAVAVDVGGDGVVGARAAW